MSTLRHGQSLTPEYKAWKSMRYRCNVPTSHAYPNYGGRGVRVCADWDHPRGFDAFYRDMGPKPSARHTLDRIDSNGDYSPENCRWSDWVTQENNRRINVRITFNGVTHTAAEWSRIVGVPQRCLRQRLRTMSVDEALTRPHKVRRSRPRKHGYGAPYVGVPGM